MLLLGLTGGIATGKSTVSKAYAEQGVDIVDADKIARDVVLPGTCGYKRIVRVFGREILLEDGTIDRPRLGRIIFGDDACVIPCAHIALTLIIESVAS